MFAKGFLAATITRTWARHLGALLISGGFTLPCWAITSSSNPPAAPNGTASNGMFPAVGGIFVDADNNPNTGTNGAEQQLCTGTLISSMHMLTAAHCFNGSGSNSWKTFSGEVHFETAPNVTQFFNFMRVKQHSSWVANNFANNNSDIALIKLKQKISSTNIMPVPLFTGNNEVALTANNGATLVGWGVTNDGTSGVSRFGTNEVDSIGGGTTLLSDFDPPPLAGAADVGTGAGDSGGPLLVNNGGTTQLAGVLSFSDDLMNVDHHTAQFGHTRVSSFNAWIQMMTSMAQVGNFSGSWSLDQETFITAASGGHHGLDTINLQESATDLNSFDLEISIPTMTQGGSAMLAIDKKVTNMTAQNWSGFDWTIGTGIKLPGGDFFQPSNETDLLFFKANPAPVESNGFLPVVTFDEPVDPDSINFASNPVGGTLAPGQMVQFWVGLSVPDDIDGMNDGMATFSIRQRPIAVPEPTTFALLIGIAMSLTRQRNRKPDTLVLARR